MEVLFNWTTSVTVAYLWSDLLVSTLRGEFGFGELRLASRSYHSRLLTVGGIKSKDIFGVI